MDENHRKPRRIFFAGTDTDVGKTYAASLFARRLHAAGRAVGVYKPVASGCREVDGTLIAEDAVALWQAAGQPRTLDDVCPQRFIAPLAPTEAATREGRSVDVAQLEAGLEVWDQNSDIVIVEGAGGLFSPLADGVLNIDLVQRLDATLVLVAANRLGVIHQVLSTCAAATAAGIRPFGILLSEPSGAHDPSKTSNPQQITRYTDIPILGQIAFGSGPESLDGLQQLLLARTSKR